MPLTFIDSQKGKKLLILENYTYSLQEKINEKVIWRCTRYRDIKCCVRVHTTSEDIDDSRANRRVTLEQRELMLAFMMEHPQIAAGRVPGAEMKQGLWEQLTRLLNGCRNGSTKSVEKWCKSWQDWKTDTKVKAIKVRRQNQSVGPGSVKANLTVLEDKLLRFIKTISSIGVNGVLEQLNTSNSQSCDPDITVKEEPLEDPLPMAPPSPFELSLENQSPSEPVDAIQESAIDDYEDHSDQLATLRDPQTEALQNIAVSMDRMASAMESMASAIQNAVILAGKFLDKKS